MGSIDRVIRVLVALVIGALFFSHVITGTVALILLVLGGVFLLTSMISVCPLYLPFGINTRGENKAN